MRETLKPGTLARLKCAMWFNFDGPPLSRGRQANVVLNKGDLFVVIENCVDTSLDLHEQWHLVMTRFGKGWLSVTLYDGKRIHNTEILCERL